jgi:hypothetical protein
MSETPSQSRVELPLDYASVSHRGWPGVVRLMVLTLAMFVGFRLGQQGIELIWMYQREDVQDWTNRIHSILAGASAVGQAALLWGLLGCLKWTIDGYRIALGSAKFLTGVFVLVLLWELWQAIEWAREMTNAYQFWMTGLYILAVVFARLVASIIPVIAWVLLSRPMVREMFPVISESD